MPLAQRLVRTPIGEMLAAANDDGLVLFEFAGRRRLPDEVDQVTSKFGQPTDTDHAHIQQIEREMAEYFNGTLRTFQTPILLFGSSFEMNVWNLLLQIPYGKTTSYGWIADQLGIPGSQRAVGKANGANKLAIIVPCHRVIRSDGSLCGYGGGLWRKQRLLELEGALPKDEQLQLSLPAAEF